ncbi:MAG: ATP synthase subunit I [Methylococcales bacterium]|nr:ATP synthase subunit I [Methylococcales bacterium]
MAVENRFSTVWKILYAQILMTVVVTSGFLWMGGWKSALSPLLGSGIALVPNLFFAYKIYLARNEQAQTMVNAFYTGEAIKLVLTVTLFAIVFQLSSVDFATMLIGYIAVLSVFWFALFYWRD